jgi:hypothetical protein
LENQFQSMAAGHHELFKKSKGFEWFYFIHWNLAFGSPGRLLGTQAFQSGPGYWFSNRRLVILCLLDRYSTKAQNDLSVWEFRTVQRNSSGS